MLIVFFSIASVTGQERIVTGQVTSVEDGYGLPGVSVYFKGTTRGTVTDIDGNYKISGVQPETILVFSYVGFETQEVAVGSQSQINIVLNVIAAELGEVMVTALGVKRQKREIGYSTEKIDAEVIARSNAPNFLNAISGRSAGVQIMQGDGVEGGSTRIVIRGNNNIRGNNQPLIVVDNVPMDNVPGLSDIGRGVDWGNPLSDINPLDIEDYSVLKGGAASALYGSRGANGVILITTKRGKKQKGIGVSYSFTHKIVQPYRYREVQDTYGHGGPISLTPPTFPTNGDTLLYPGIYSTDNLVINQNGDTRSSAEEFGYYGSAVSWGPRMDGQMVQWWDGEMRPYSAQPENLEMPFKNGYTNTHNIAASGGGERGTMRVSITRQDHQPIINNSNFNRTTINLGTNLKVSEKVFVDLSFSYIKFNRLNSPTIGEDYNAFSKGLLYSWPRSYKGLDYTNYMLPDGSQKQQEGYPFYYINRNLWWDYYNNNTTLERDKYMGALTLTYNITDWLSVLGRAGRDFTLENYQSKYKPTDLVGIQNGYYADSLRRMYSDNFEFIATAFKDNIFNSKINAKFTAGVSRWDNNLYNIGGRSGEKWYFPNTYTFFNYTENTYMTDDNGQVYVEEFGDGPGDVYAFERVYQRRTNSVYGFLNLSYDNYLFLELTGRNDWSSTLPPESNSYFYPSVSLSFVATEAFPIQEKVDWLNFVKLRGGVAQSATDTDPYKLNLNYTTGIMGGQQYTGFPNTIPPWALKPQRVNSYEVGLNLGFFENRIDFDFTYYYFYSFDQIIVSPVPYSSGANNVTINDGELTNNGIEIILNTVPVQTSRVLFKTGINFARNRNYVKSLGDYADVYPIGDIWGANGPAMALREGDEFGTIYGYDHIYLNDQPVVNEEGTKYLITDVRVPIGNASPHFIAGWTTELSYKNFTLATLVDTKWGGDIYCGSYVIGLQTGQSPETLKEREGGGLPYTDPDGNTSNIGIILDGVHEDRTTNETVVHYYYKYMPNAGGWGKIISTPGIVENTWVKMREISLSYTLPPKIIHKLKFIQGLTLSIIGRDLFYFYTTLPDKIKPEGIIGSGNAQGFEWSSFPGTRSFTFGLNVNF